MRLCRFLRAKKKKSEWPRPPSSEREWEIRAAKKKKSNRGGIIRAPKEKNHEPNPITEHRQGIGEEGEKKKKRGNGGPFSDVQ